LRSAKWSYVAAALISAYGGENAYAQRADENALESAEDAFGTTVGGETIGLYSASNARGFSPVRAGNLRLEGLFFDARGGGGGFVKLSNRLVGQNTIRVGLSAQSYPFPAPTGIADFTIRVPGEKPALSTVFRGAYPETVAFELDAQTPVTDSFSLGGGFSIDRAMSDWAVTNYNLDVAIIGRWKVTDDFQVMPFYSRQRQFGNEWGPFIFSAGTDLPVKYDRSKSLTQRWSDFDNDDANFGTITRANWNDWNLSAGVFRSISWRRGGESTQLHWRNVQPNGNADLYSVTLAAQENPNESTSGEARLTRHFIEGDRRHTFFFNTRAKRIQNGFGGNATRPFGTGNILDPVVLPDPNVRAGTRGREYVRQYSGGISYQMLWRDVGEFSAGLQRTRYTRFTRFVDPTGPETTNEWLYNATLAAYLTKSLVLYSGYTRGLEDAPRAPPFALNAGASASATITSQIDGGFRYTVMPGLTLVGGVFQVKKPFFDLDQTGFFKKLGNVRHRGVEVSLSGSPLPGLTVVTGLVGLKARLSGPLVDSGAMGAIPPDTVPLTGLFTLQYGPQSWKGFSIDGRFSYNDPYIANVENTFKSASVRTVDVGARYRFKLADNNALLRFQVQNLFDVWEWQVQGTQRQIQPTPRRKVSLQLTVDY
jgi:iron complex outermembrane receptor protein